MQRLVLRSLKAPKGLLSEAQSRAAQLCSAEITAEGMMLRLQSTLTNI